MPLGVFSETIGEVMAKKKQPVFGQLNETVTLKGNSLVWSVKFDGVRNIVFFMENGWGQISHSTVAVDDAEAIGYSLLYAAKLAREGSGTGGE